MKKPGVLSSFEFPAPAAAFPFHFDWAYNGNMDDYDRFLFRIYQYFGIGYSKNNLKSVWAVRGNVVMGEVNVFTFYARDLDTLTMIRLLS